MSEAELIEKMARALYAHSNDEVSWEAAVQLADNGDTFMLGLADYTRSEARAALAAIRESGLVLAPVEPTQEMFTAGHFAVRGMDPKCVKTVDWEQVYRAMIAASQKEPHHD